LKLFFRGKKTPFPRSKFVFQREGEAPLLGGQWKEKEKVLGLVAIGM
jgi:hypothetical protein